MKLDPGSVFAGYAIERLIGAGGMGSVYLARHPHLPRLDALKLLSPEFTADHRFTDRFLREGEILARLSHPHILPVHDRGSENGQLWISMPYVHGRDAEQAMEAYPTGMPAELAVHIVEQVGSALDYAHRQHLLHRDVKPANILLAPPVEIDDLEWVFLTDFGIAKSVDEITPLTMTGSVIASFVYASPEQIEGRQLDHRTDIYSLGGVLHRLLTGSVPYPATSIAAVMNGHINLPQPRPSELVPDLPPGFDQVVEVAMAKLPPDRYQSCRDLASAAKKALDYTSSTVIESAPVTGPPPNPETSPHPITRRRRRRQALLVVALVLFSAAGAGLYFRPQNEETTTAATAALPMSHPLPDSTMIVTRVMDEIDAMYPADATTAKLAPRLDTAGGIEIAKPVISPDRRSVVYLTYQSSAKSHGIRVIAADGSGDRDLFPARVPGCDRYLTPAWNPVEPDELAMACLSSGRFSLQILTLDGNPVQQFNVGSDWVDSVTFSPDGRNLLYFRRVLPDPRPSLYRVAADNSSPEIRLTKGHYDTDPAYSPDGSQILFNRKIGETQSAIMIMSADGSDVRMLTEDTSDDRNPAWSPDGRSIAFRSSRGQAEPTQYRFMVMDADGTNVRPLITGDQAQAKSSPAWALR